MCRVVAVVRHDFIGLLAMDKSMIKLLLIGGGGHCRSCIDVIRLTNRYEIVGILDTADKVGVSVDGVPVIGTDAELKKYLAQVDECLITVGQVGDGALRKNLYTKVVAANGRLATVLSPSAYVSESANIGGGTIVMHHAIVNAGATVAQNVILNSMSLIEHDAKISSHTHISTRATVNGGTMIGESCFIGSHAVIFNHCSVGKYSIVGGGQVVRHDLPEASKPSDVFNKHKALPTFVIAEAGVNHNGDVQLAMEMIEVAAKAGADAVKFQTFRAEDLSTAYAEKADYQKRETSEDESQQEMLKALELPEAVYTQLIDHCEAQGVEFMSTAFDIQSMDFLVALGIQRIKIPSGELTNVPLLRHCAKQGLPIILSTGMASFEEVSYAKKILVDAGVKINNLSILHCNTAYPTPFEDANLACIQSLSKLGATVGYSDHTLGDEAVIASIAMGALIVEKHFTLDRNLPGPDQSTSLEPDELSYMIERIRHIEQAFGNGVKEPTASELSNISVARKSIVASKLIKVGDVFSDENLTTKRPGNGVSAALWDTVIGGVSTRCYNVDEQIEY